MTLGEKIRKYRLLHNLKQKDLGMMIGFSPATADSRIRKYEGDIMAPKSDIRNKLVQALDVDYSALSDIDIRSIEDVIRVFFFMEEYLGFEIEKVDLDNYQFFSKDKVYFQERDLKNLNSYIYIWQQQKKNLLNAKNDNEEDSSREYDLWKSRFPRDIHNYWNSLLTRIDDHYIPLVTSLEKTKSEITDSSGFVTQIRRLIQSGLEFTVSSELRHDNGLYLNFTFMISDLLSPKSKEVETQFAEFINMLNTLDSYGIVIEKTVLTNPSGNTITYHILHNALATKRSLIEEMINFESNRESMSDFNKEMFDQKLNEDFHRYNIDLTEITPYYKQEND
ncbi:MAG: helix-turn-helix transcriptional regulator [Clostridia bacterium]|nr:helix-turn-helix transcriptional regulator [Clostridia bacterium]